MRMLLALLLVLACLAQEKTGWLTGTVADMTEARVTTATVHLEAPSGATRTVHVDKEGVFEFGDSNVE